MWDGYRGAIFPPSAETARADELHGAQSRQERVFPPALQAPDGALPPGELPGVVDLEPAEHDPDLFRGEPPGLARVGAVRLEEVAGGPQEHVPAQGPRRVRHGVRPRAYGLQSCHHRPLPSDTHP